MTSGTHPQPRPDRLLAQHNRAAALARIARVRGASVVGAGALTAGVAALVSAIAPGHTLGAKVRPRIVASTRSVPASRASVAALPPLATPGQLGLSAPGSAPSAPVPTQPSAPTQQAAPTQQVAPTQQAAPVVSGGS